MKRLYIELLDNHRVKIVDHLNCIIEDSFHPKYLKDLLQQIALNYTYEIRFFVSIGNEFKLKNLIHSSYDIDRVVAEINKYRDALTGSRDESLNDVKLLGGSNEDKFCVEIESIQFYICFQSGQFSKVDFSFSGHYTKSQLKALSKVYFLIETIESMYTRGYKYNEIHNYLGGIDVS